jgi:hypothetical protein
MPRATRRTASLETEKLKAGVIDMMVSLRSGEECAHRIQGRRGEGCADMPVVKLTAANCDVRSQAMDQEARAGVSSFAMSATGMTSPPRVRQPRRRVTR